METEHMEIADWWKPLTLTDATLKSD